MRIVFVDNLLLEQSGGRYDTVLQPHLGLISLIAVVEKAGHEAFLYDPKLPVSRGELLLRPSLYREIAHEILHYDPDVVGMTSLGCNFICTVKIARHLRQLRPAIPILLGGPHATVLDQSILRTFDVFDVVVRHEAEHTIVPLLDALHDHSFDKVPGVTYRDRTGILATAGEPLILDLDTLPDAAYDHYPIADLGLNWLRVEAGRGCPFMCTFCSTATFFGRRYRLKTAARLCEELDRLHSQYGISHFSLQHDLFTVNRSKVLAFCDAVASRNYTWKCSARMDCVDPELLERMSAAGCREIYFGIETGSPRMQKISQKRLDLALFEPTLDAIDQVRMSGTVSFITGYPQEQLQDQQATLDLIGSCFYRRPPPHNVQLHMLTPEPGTGLLTEFQSRLAYDGYVTDFNFPTLEGDDADLIRLHPDVFMNHHYFQSVLPRQRHILVTSVYYVLYRLGPLVITQLLDHYGGRLGALVEAFVSWAESLKVGVSNDASLIDFVAAKLGPNHYLTSLVRYMLAVAQFSSKAKFDRESSRDHAEQSDEEIRRLKMYAIGHRAVMLRNLHACPDILAFLEEQRTSRTLRSSITPVARSSSGRSSLKQINRASRRIASADGGNVSIIGPSEMACSKARDTIDVPLALRRKRMHTLVVLDRYGSDRIRNFMLDDDGADVLDFVLQSRTGDALLKALGSSASSQRAIHEFACNLLRIGALEETRGEPNGEGARPRWKAGEWGDVRIKQVSVGCV